MKKNAIVILIFVLISCLKTNDKRQTNEHIETEYYTNLAGIISPNLEYLGRGKISKVEARTLKHYRFIYNGGRLLKIQYFDKNQPNDNSYYGTHEVKYNYLEDQLIRSYYNAKGKKASTYRHYYFGNDIHKEIFQLDKNKDKTSLILKDSLNNQIESGIGSYVFKFHKIDDRNFIQKQFKKDGSPNVLTLYFPFYNSKISTQKNGFLSSIANVNVEGNLTMNEDAGYASVIFDFDEYGNELGWSFQDVSYNLSNRKECFDMDYGFAKVVYKFNWENKELGLHRGFEEAYFDENNNPTENNTGIHLIQYEYDQSGNFSRMRRYNLEGIEVK